jgi:hypothetical protein
MAAAVGIALAVMGPAAAATDVQPPSDPAAKAAFDVLEKHCARCHQDGKLVDRERPARGFGNVLKLEELAANPNHILPGNPFGSKLFKQIADKEMPYDVEYEGETRYPKVSEADLKALEGWIKGLGSKTAAACEGRQFVAHQDMIGMMAADLEKMPRARRSGTRYLTLTHLKNACTGDEAMKVYRQGAIKLVNSLSRSSTIVRLETVDPEETIIRINIDDLGWDNKDWDRILAVNPYNTQPDTQLSGVLKTATGSQLPYVRADWFAFVAAQPPLYDELLKLPNTFQALAKEQGVDLDGNIRRFLAQRSGFQKSGVSQNNRLIERHPSKAGYFWTSYDFAGNKARQSLFEHPLGPNGRDAFQHDGGETIYSLPNGFQAYYLNTEKGTKLDKGPTSIVRDLSRKDLAVTNGISCIGCHDQGMRKAKDEVRGVVLAGRSFSRETREAVEALYPPTDKMDRIIEEDGKRFADAMIRAGLEPTLKLNGVEMTNALAKRYEDDIDLNLATAELGLTADQFKQASGDAERRFRPLIRRLEQGSVPRDQFEAMFRELAINITDEQVVRVAAVPGQPAPKVATPTSGVDLSLTSDKDVYKVGDRPTFTVVASRDCFLQLSSVDDRGVVSVLFPNKFMPNNQIKAKAEVHFPPANAPFQFRLKDPGSENVTAVCTDDKRDTDGIKHDFNARAFSGAQNYTRTIAGNIGGAKRQIVIDPKTGGKRQIEIVPTDKVERPKTNTGVPVATQKPVETGSRESFRAAITIKVE